MDPASRRAFWEVLAELQPKYATLLITQFPDEAEHLADKVNLSLNPVNDQETVMQPLCGLCVLSAENKPRLSPLQLTLCTAVQYINSILEGADDFDLPAPRMCS